MISQPSGPRAALSQVRCLLAALFAATTLSSLPVSATSPSEMFTWIDPSRVNALASNFGERERYWFARLLQVTSTRCPKGKFGPSFKCLRPEHITQAIRTLICPSYRRGKEKKITGFLNRLNKDALVRSYIRSPNFGGKARVTYRLTPRFSKLEMHHWKMRRGKKQAGPGISLFLSCSRRIPDLTGTNLSKMDLRGEDLRGADLRWTYLTGADLSGAKLNGADLRKTFLRGTDLSGADLTGTDLRGTNLKRAKGLTREQLESVRINKKSQLPAYLNQHVPARQ